MCLLEIKEVFMIKPGFVEADELKSALKVT